MADTNERLEADLRELVDQASSLLLSPREVSQRLAALSANTFAASARLTVSFLGEDFSWGVDAALAGTVEALSEEIGEGVSARLQCAAWPRTAQEQSCLAAFGKLARALWGVELRGRGGIELQRQIVRAQMTRSVSRLAEQASTSRVLIVFADLDNFGTLNKQVGQESGDKALRFVNAKFHDLCRAYGGLPFHQSGDEFCLVMPDAGLLAALKGLRRLRQDIRSREFLGSDSRVYRVDLTVGMYWIPATSTIEQIDAARGAAEDTAKRRLENGDLAKRRGKVCFPSQVTADTNTVCSPTELAMLGIVLVRRRLDREAFGDPRLNLIASVAQDAAVNRTGFRGGLLA